MDKYLKEGKNLRSDNSKFSNTRLIKKKNNWDSILRQQQSIVPHTIFILILIGLIFGGWGTVYAANDSLPNDLLYSVKLMRENLALSITSEPKSRISLLTTFANRRADEATILTSQGKSIPEKLPVLMESYLDEVNSLTASMDEDSYLGAITGIYIHKRDQDQDMTGPKSSYQPPRTMNKKGQDSTQIALDDQTAILTPLTSTSEVTVTLTITTGQYGPGPCEKAGACTPPVNEHSPGSYEGIPPGSDNYEGYGPGSDQGVGAQKPPDTSPTDVIEKSKQTEGKKP